MDAQTVWIDNLQGLNESYTPGDTSGLSPDLSNVIARYGSVSARGGMSNYGGVSQGSVDSPIIGLFQNTRNNDSNNQLVRMTPSRFELFDSGAWTNLTGVALNGGVLTRPQFTMVQGNTVFTNEGSDRPRKFDGSANSVVLGGSPPYAKAIAEYMGFCMLGNVSDDGTFTDILDGNRVIVYSPTFDSSWDLCEGNTIDLNQTNGDLLRMMVLGRALMNFKTDGVVKSQFVGGTVRFLHELMPIAGQEGTIGTNSPLSISHVGSNGIAMLGGNGLIYKVTNNDIQAIMTERFITTMPAALDAGRLKYARGITLSSKNLYILFFDSTGTADYLDSFVAWNYETNECGKGTLGVPIASAAVFKNNNSAPEKLVLGTSSLVKEFDSTTSVNDGLAAVNRYWTSGWRSIEGDGLFYGARLLFKKSAFARVKVSIATDLDLYFEHEQNFSLRAPSATSDIVEVYYKLASPIPVSWVNVRVRFFADRVGAPMELLRVGLVQKPIHATPETAQRIQDSKGPSGD